MSALYIAIRRGGYNRKQRMRLSSGILALLLTPPGTPSGGFRWQRIVTPPAEAPAAQACILLDAATFANTAPALRDLRLFQDGLELPYAIEESYDPRALDTGTTPADDRSLYETALAVPIPQSGQAEAELPAHVPVERLRLEPGRQRDVAFTVQVTERGAASRAASERIAGILPAAAPAFPLTLGANLQHAARLTVTLQGSQPAPTRAVFEMRRRSLCYQPRSASPLTLYLGGGPGMAARTYRNPSSFAPALDRAYAALGPLVPNDAEQNDRPATGARKRLLWAAALAAVFFIFSATRMLRSGRRDT